MKRLFALLVFCALLSRSPVHAQNADDQYVRIYSLIQEGDNLSDANHPRDALGKYREAQTNLMHFQRTFPSWNALVVDFRLSYLTGQIAEVQAKLPAEAPRPVVVTPAVTVPAQPSVEQAAQLNALRTQVGMLEAERQNLEAKLKEAFAAQPAAVDPREFAKAQEDVRALQKENDLLKTSLTQAQEQAARPVADPKVVAQLKQQLEESNRQLAEASDKSSKQTAAKAAEAAAANDKLATVQRENDSLKTSLQAAQASVTNSAVDTKAVAQLKQQLEESNQKLAQASGTAAKDSAAKASAAAAADEKLAALQKENDSLKTGIQHAQANASASAADTQALAQLKQQLADSNSKLAAATDEASKAASAKAAEAAAANDKLVALQKQNEKLNKKLIDAEAATASSAADTKAVAQLKQQLADSNRKLADASDKASKLTGASEREATAANDKLTTLQRENEALKMSLSSAQATIAKPAVDPKAVTQLKQQLADSNRKLAEASDKAAKLAEARTSDLAAASAKLTTLQNENESLKSDLKKAQSAAEKSGDTKVVDQLKEQLAESNVKLAAETDRATKLAAEHQAAPPVDTKETEEAAMLRKENDVLKQQLTTLQMPVANANPGDVNQQLSQTKAQLAALQSDTEILKLENLALANRAAAAVAAPVNTAAIVSPPPANVRAKPAAPKEQAQKKPKKLVKDIPPDSTATVVPATNSATASIVQTNVEVAATPSAPYTPEQLAQFKEPAPALATNSSETAVDAPKLLTEAQSYFAAGQFDKAEGDYLQVLQGDPTNVFVLANLAAIEVELNKYDDADKHAQQAVTLAPTDAYNLSVLGNLRFHQGRYDDALTVLNKAAEINPQSAEIQNYLGVTLSHKGMREQAESALRKAIQLDPKYGGAHNNLAVMYLAQEPPFVELARWHYQKALAAGFPHNLELEKELDAKTAAAAAATPAAPAPDAVPAPTPTPTQ